MAKIVLLSGGIDSLVLAEMYRREGTLAGLIFIDYAHPAQKPEGWKSFAYAGTRGLLDVFEPVHAFGLNLGDMGTEDNARVVPHRNAMFLSIAANHAPRMGGTSVALGATRADYRDYEDCRPNFFGRMARVIQMPIMTPLINMHKRQVIELAHEYGLARTDAWSCYKGGPSECGECPSCVEAAKAWG